MEGALVPSTPEEVHLSIMKREARLRGVRAYSSGLAHDPSRMVLMCKVPFNHRMPQLQLIRLSATKIKQVSDVVGPVRSGTTYPYFLESVR